MTHSYGPLFLSYVTMITDQLCFYESALAVEAVTRRSSCMLCKTAVALPSYF